MMSILRSRLKTAHVVAALALTSFMTSTAGQAVTPLAVQKAVDEATDEDALQPQPAIVHEPAEAGFEHVGEGEASYYGNELAGNRTASGERFNPRALTAAHRTLPLGSKLRVTNKANGKSVIVRINDRGPFAKARLIDVSFAAAQEL
ncbi:MAG: septal ring lytic transglycosylase RlpA family protein, partial [Pseudomonadota bacterium]|nr:septal ring lytic transglycosylase RlpA family protein [Pseudomonadota bacterium]